MAYSIAPNLDPYNKNNPYALPLLSNISVAGHFSVKIDFTQFRKYRSLCSREVKRIGVEHLLFFRIRNEGEEFSSVAKARKVISLEFAPFVKLTKVKLSCRNAIGYGSYMTNVLQ